jgi:NitT/TauT family transport system substrate-binding protein
MKRTVFKILAICISFCFLTACVGNNLQNTNETRRDSKATITVIVPKSSASLPVFKMIESKALGEDVDIDVQVFDSTEAMITMSSSMKYSFITMPVHTAATVYNKGLDVELINVFAWGGMHLVTTDTACESWENLKGKELYVLSKGSVPDILTQYFLNQHGLVIGETIEVVYSTYPEISQLMGLGRIKYAVDGEPFSTSNTENIENYKIISDYSAEWKSTAGNEYSLPAYGLAANSTFLSQNEEFAKSFMEEFEKAVSWMVNNPEDAGNLAEKYLNADDVFIEKAIPNFNFNYVSSEAAKKDIEKYYDILFAYRPEMIGGEIPDESFYHKDE